MRYLPLPKTFPPSKSRITVIAVKYGILCVFISLQVFINFAKNQTDGMGEDAPSAAPELEEQPPYHDEEAGPRVSFVRMSDFTPGSEDV